MQNKEFPIRSFGAVLVLGYTLLAGAVTFVLNISMGVKISITVVSLIVFALALGRSTPGHPGFGTEVDEEGIQGIVRPPSHGGH